MDTKAAFEKWFLSIGGSVSMTADEKYRTDRARMAWWAWKASRAALLKNQVKEQEEFLDHLADFEHEDTLHD